MDAHPPQLLVVGDDPMSIQVIAMTLDEVRFATDAQAQPGAFDAVLRRLDRTITDSAIESSRPPR